MNAEQLEIVKWWQSGCDYQMGVMLLAKHCKNKVLVHTLMKPGKEKFEPAVKKLRYELPKSVGLDWLKMPVHEGKKEEQSAPVKPAAPGGGLSENNRGEEKRAPLVSDKPLDQYPAIIRRIKYQYSDLYKQRSVKHKTMREVAEANSEHNIAKRAGLLADIKRISGEMDHLYRFIEEYEKNGTLPSEEIVWPPAPKRVSADLPVDVVQLRKLKKNLQTANTKDRNRLLYQQRTQSGNEKPMPKGPKRTKIEYRIKARETEILGIDTKIVKLENAD